MDLIRLVTLSGMVLLAVLTQQSSTSSASYVCEKPSDIIFLLDTSNSIWKPDFEKQLDFVRHVVSKFTIGPENMRIGVVAFSDYPRLQFHLNRYNRKKEVKQAIGRMRQHGGVYTFTSDAIHYMRTRSFRADKGGREGVTKIGIIITDGRSYDTEVTAVEAALAREEGIHMFAIGVGNRVDAEELKAIASQPTDHYSFMVENYAGLKQMQGLLAEKTCTVTDPPPTTTTTTTTPPPVTTTPPPVTSPAVFTFPKIRFVTTQPIVQMAPEDKPEDDISAVLEFVMATAEVIYPDRPYGRGRGDEDGVPGVIEGLPPGVWQPEGPYEPPVDDSGPDMYSVLDTVPDVNSLPDVDYHGHHDVQVGENEIPDVEAHQRGDINLIGPSDGYSEEELLPPGGEDDNLTKLKRTPKYRSKSRDRWGTPYYGPPYQGQGCRPVDPTDFVFVVDSKTSGDSYQRYIWDFVRDVISRMDMDGNQVRTQFVHECAAVPEMRLDMYTNKQELLQEIQEVIDTPRRTASLFRSMSAKIAEIQDPFLERRKVGIYITEGHSQDVEETLQAAEEARKQFGIELFGVGIGGRINPDEMRRIIDPQDHKHLFLMSHHLKLEKVARHLVKQLCKRQTTQYKFPGKMR